MAKTKSSSQRAEEKPKSPAAFANTAQDTRASKLNPSRFEPTDDAIMDSNALAPEDGLLKLLVDSVKDLYWAENHLIMALPKMASAASSEVLSQAILDHLEQTKTHSERLERVFELMGKKVQAQKCDGIEGLTKEGEAVIEDTDPGTPARDLGIIMASQKVEHYEIAAYTGLSNLAARLRLPDVADLLTQTLNEEQESDDILAGIADKNIMMSDSEEA